MEEQQRGWKNTNKATVDWRRVRTAAPPPLTDQGEGKTGQENTFLGDSSLCDVTEGAEPHTSSQPLAPPPSETTLFSVSLQTGEI